MKSFLLLQASIFASKRRSPGQTWTAEIGDPFLQWKNPLHFGAVFMPFGKSHFSWDCDFVVVVVAALVVVLDLVVVPDGFLVVPDFVVVADFVVVGEDPLFNADLTAFIIGYLPFCYAESKQKLLSQQWIEFFCFIENYLAAEGVAEIVQIESPEHGAAVSARFDHVDLFYLFCFNLIEEEGQIYLDWSFTFSTKLCLSS